MQSHSSNSTGNITVYHATPWTDRILSKGSIQCPKLFRMGFTERYNAFLKDELKSVLDRLEAGGFKGQIKDNYGLDHVPVDGLTKFHDFQHNFFVLLDTRMDQAVHRLPCHSKAAAVLELSVPEDRLVVPYTITHKTGTYTPMDKRESSELLAPLELSLEGTLQKIHFAKGVKEIKKHSGPYEAQGVELVGIINGPV
jgi:hypothetical protein